MTPSSRAPSKPNYAFRVEADETGGYAIVFPDLPGCMTQVEDVAEIGPAAEEIKTLWLETARDHGMPIPPPTAPASYSGKFVVRVPRSLHRYLAESAAREGVSLNQYVATLLARNDALARVERLVTDAGRGAATAPSDTGDETRAASRRRGTLSVVRSKPSS
jgi:predicted RNase H-like HicB family nuclease